MAIRSQLRLVQLTGSLNDGGARIGSDVPFAATSLQGVLDQAAAAIKKIHGADGFSMAAAGEFSHAITPASADGASLGSDAKEWSDLFLADGSVISLGNDGDVTLTHDPDAGVRLNTDKELQLRDSAIKVFSSANSQLDLEADGEIQAVAPVIDLDASTAVRVSNDLELDSDDAVLKFGAGGDVSLTHVHDTGLLLNGDMQLQFRDATEYIQSDADGDMMVRAATTVNLNIDGTDELSVTSTVSTFGGHIAIPNDGQIGSAGAADAMIIESDGDVKFKKDLVLATEDSSIVNGSFDSITFNQEEVIVHGDLTVKGTTTSVDTTNLEVEDKFIGLNYTSGSISGGTGDVGIIMAQARGDTPTNVAMYYDQSESRFKFVTTLSPASGSSIADAGFSDLEVADLWVQGLEIKNETAAAMTLTAGAAPDVSFSNNASLADDKLLRFGTDTNVTLGYKENGAGFSEDKFEIVVGTGEGMNLVVPAAKNIALTVDSTAALIALASGIQVNGSSESKIEASTGKDMLLQGVASQDIRIDSEQLIKFADGNDASWSDQEGIALSSGTSSWVNFEAAFGEVSLLDAIVAAQGGAGTLQKRVVAVTAAINAGTDVQTAADLDALSPAEIDERVDVYVNGQMMVSASDISGNGDYSLDVGDGLDDVDVQFQFNLVPDDVVTLVVR